MKLYYFLAIFLLFGSIRTFGQVPTLNCPTDIIMPTDPGSCDAVVTYTAPTCASNCTGAVITQTDATGLSSGSTFPIDTTLLEYTITGPGGSSTCTFMVIVQDNEAPVFIPACPGDLTATSDPGVCGAMVAYLRPKGIDQCGTFPTLQTDGTGLTASSIFPVGVTQQQYECTDDAGNTATCIFSITVTDVEAPTFSDCPTPQTFNSTAGMCGANVTYTLPTGDDNCVITTLSQVDGSGLTSGDFFPIGTTTQQYLVTDQYGINGANCIMEIIVTDVNAPTITCPADQDQYMDASCQTTLNDYTGLAVFTDECSQAIVSVTQSPAIGTLISSTGTQVVTLTATDTSGNSSSCNFNVNVSDTISPSVTCLGNQNVSASSGCDAILGDYTGSVTTSDNCDSNPIVTQSPASGTTITSSQLVTITSTDISGNATSCTFLVIVDDPVAPTISCPADSTSYVDGNCDYTVPDFRSLVTVADNCDPNPSVQQIPSPGAVISGTGSQFISFSVSDVSGNTSFCSFVLTLADTSGPSLTCSPDLNVYLDNNCEYTLVDYSSLVTAVDNCGSAFVSQSPAIGNVVNGTDSPVAITITAQDLIGNTSSCTFNLILLDTISPVITQCVGDTIVAADTNCNYIIGDFTTLITGTDNCSSTFTITQSVNQGDTLLAGGPYPVTLYLADDNNNVDSCTFTIKVEDVTSPTLSCPLNPDVPSNASCSYVIPAYDTVLNISDNCSGFTYTQSVAAGTIISGIGTQQAVSIFVTDAVGNINSCSFTITVVDTVAPTITCPPDQSIDINGLCQYMMPDLTGMALIADLCDTNLTINQSPGVGVVMTGINVVTITVTDSSGNTNSCTLNVSPNDTVAPTITCPDNISSCSNVISYTAPTGVDDCVTATTLQTDTTGLTSGSTFPVGTSTIEYTTTDLVGNSSSCTFDITVFEPVTIDPGTATTIEEGDSTTIEATISNAASFVWTPDYNMDNDTVENPTVAPGITTYYVLSAVSPDGCTATDSVLIIVNTIDTLIVSNFFSPNGDQSNQTWTVNKPSLISGCWVTIFNRWGRKVWESSSYNNQWDGTNVAGEPLPEGTYFYVISCANGDPVKGSVLLMR